MGRARGDLYPPVRPYHKGFLTLGEGPHELYFEECGNPKGEPILFLHGGPGAGCDKTDRRFFDPKKWRIILFDQRGSGRSKPFASLYKNTTRHLVFDIKLLLGHLGVSRATLFGGSWGSTLALVYALKYPDTVKGMILRGIFLAERAECGDYLDGTIDSRFPEVREHFLSRVPKSARLNPAEYYYVQMTSGSSQRRKRFAYEWTRYELARMRLQPKSEAELDKEIRSFPYESLAVLEAYYIRNFCFLEDGYILKNVRRLPQVPISIIHGRYDDICPVENAFRLHKVLPHAELQVVVAGHASTDPEIQKKLVLETDALYSKIKK